MQGSKGETGRIKAIASILIGRKDPLFPLCVPKRKKKRKKKKSSLSGFIIARLRYPRYTFYRSKFIGPRYFFMVQVVRAHLCKHYESKSPQYERKTVGEKGERVTISPSFFFFLSFLHSYDTLGTNREYLQFEFLRDLIPCYQDYYLYFFFFYSFGNV